MGEKTASAKGVLESFGLKDKLKTVSIDLSTGWKFISARAKHEAKTFNKKARKALATYEEGSSVRYDQVYNCDFDVGFSVWKRFQGSWREMREESDKNTCLAEGADVIINDVFKEWQKWESTVSQFHENLVAIPDIIAQVEIAQAQLAKIGDQISKVEKLLVEHEDVVMKVELERKKCNEKLELSKLVEKRQKAYQEMKAKYEMTEEESGEMAMVLERQESIEKQQVYEDAFLEQMEKYIRYGELERPIVGSVEHHEVPTDISFDESDFDALKEFLGPEELDTVMKSQALWLKSCDGGQSNSENLQNPSNIDSDANEVKDIVSNSDASTEEKLNQDTDSSQLPEDKEHTEHSSAQDKVDSGEEKDVE
ncbi:dysbindin-like isoform X2 [Rhopilema esculentum]|uniref:dysbindin-like isoform X2 n=1 Tax=Rhopilema esculentum TaxID=499914 RepID=UPI0031CE59D0